MDVRAARVADIRTGAAWFAAATLLLVVLPGLYAWYRWRGEGSDSETRRLARSMVRESVAWFLLMTVPSLLVALGVLEAILLQAVGALVVLGWRWSDPKRKRYL